MEALLGVRARLLWLPLLIVGVAVVIQEIPGQPREGWWVRRAEGRKKICGSAPLGRTALAHRVHRARETGAKRRTGFCSIGVRVGSEPRGGPRTGEVRSCCTRAPPSAALGQHAARGLCRSKSAPASAEARARRSGERKAKTLRATIRQLPAIPTKWAPHLFETATVDERSGGVESARVRLRKPGCRSCSSSDPALGESAALGAGRRGHTAGLEGQPLRATVDFARAHASVECSIVRSPPPLRFLRTAASWLD